MTDHQPGMIQPRWPLVWLIGVGMSVLGLGLLKLAGLPWLAIAGGAIGMAILLVLVISFSKRGYREWEEQDRA